MYTDNPKHYLHHCYSHNNSTQILTVKPNFNHVRAVASGKENLIIRNLIQKCAGCLETQTRLGRPGVRGSAMARGDRRKTLLPV